MDIEVFLRRFFAFGDGGPDFLIPLDQKKIWIEAVTPGPGTGKDAVPPLNLQESEAISQKEFPYSGCWYRIDQNVVLGQCRMSFQPCFNRLHRRLTECNAFLVDFVAELDDRMKPLPGHPLGPLQHSL